MLTGHGYIVKTVKQLKAPEGLKFGDSGLIRMFCIRPAWSTNLIPFHWLSKIGCSRKRVKYAGKNSY